MSESFIPFGSPILDKSELQAVEKVLSGPTLVHGQVTKDFEHRFAERIGVKHAISLSSCTAGLHLSLFTKEIQQGDEILVPAMTHVATAHSVEFCGASPVFVDVDESSGNINPNAISNSVTSLTKGLIVVHFLGLPCDMDRINLIAESEEFFVLEDCALALDASYGSKKAGSLGLAGCFSFYPVKHITAAEGGMVTTNDDDFAAAIIQRKAFGYDRSLNQRSMPGIYDVTVLGYNYRMNEVQAAIGLTQLDKLDQFQKQRAINYQNLSNGLTSIDEITIFDPIQGNSMSSHYCLNAILPRDGRINRSDVVKNLKSSGIGTSVHYPMAVPMFTYYRDKYGYKTGQFPVAEWLASQTISLPVGPHLKTGDVERIIKAVKDAIRECKI